MDALSVYVVINLVIEAKYQVQLPTSAGLLTRPGCHLAGHKLEIMLSNIHALSIFDFEFPYGGVLEFEWYCQWCSDQLD